ncbi:hypothetical protein [Antarctobacter heliothermus]|uniref:Uncharacterized protein n=1 Tax=Antarctobacter heliothermus TaxID=74033 RepID=A0A239FN19_9RHOB|nr:hypothetical protein [Antarctobacter heliothermus]SNS58270.1 hypothetical protein SAMN04488078_102132 [Antarctobacter heliothermus]
MNWHELSANWDNTVGKLQTWFPALDRSRLADPPRDSRALTRHIADMHELTVEEARDALQDFMHREDLARRATELASQ